MNLPEAVTKLLKPFLRRLDYQALYPGTVLKDWGTLKVDVKPDVPVVASALPDLVEIPLRVSFPGLVSVKLKAGARVLLGFEQGDPSKPFALPYSATDLESFVIQTGQGHTITVDDDRGTTSEEAVYAKPYIEILDMAGNTFLLDSTPGAQKVVLSDFKGNRIICDAVANVLKLDTNTKVLINGGGTKVARAGEIVTTPSGPGSISGPCSSQLEVSG